MGKTKEITLSIQLALLNGYLDKLSKVCQKGDTNSNEH
jgi:hypothetical protein